MDNAIQDSLSEREVIAVCPRSVNTSGSYYPLAGWGEPGVTVVAVFCTRKEHNGAKEYLLDVTATSPRHGRPMRRQRDRQRGELGST